MGNKFYEYLKTEIGLIKVVADDNFILAIDFVGEDDEEQDVRKNKLTTKAIDQLEEYFDGVRKSFDLKLNIVGSEFKRKAWNELTKIPYGQTISYKEQAIRIGNEKSCRAVGTANGLNKFAIVVPCHRVIGANGKLVGYAGGLNRKAWLLEHEKKLK